MDKKNEMPFTQEELLEDLPPERSIKEIMKNGRYKALHEQCMKEYKASRRTKRKPTKSVAARSRKPQVHE